MHLRPEWNGPFQRELDRLNRAIAEAQLPVNRSVPNGIVRALALPRQPLTLPEVGGYAAAIVRARPPARRAAEPAQVRSIRRADKQRGPHQRASLHCGIP